MQREQSDNFSCMMEGERGQAYIFVLFLVVQRLAASVIAAGDLSPHYDHTWMRICWDPSQGILPKSGWIREIGQYAPLVENWSAAQ